MSDAKNIPSIDKLDESIKKRGWIKTILLYLIFYIVPFFGIDFYLNNKLGDKIANSQTVNVNNNVLGDGKKEEIKTIGETTSKTSTVSSFSQDDWLIKNFYTDSDGYLCPNVSNFDYWSIWTKKEYPLQIKSVKIRIYVKSTPKSKNPPTIAVTYGSYKNGYAPQPMYRLNIFDSDTKTIRLYNENNKSKAQDWLQELPDLSSEMVITLSPRVPDPNGRKINVNPIIKYAINDSDKQTEFTPSQNFEVVLPTVGMEDETLKKQIGVGTQKGNCFKITAFEVEQ